MRSKAFFHTKSRLLKWVWLAVPYEADSLHIIGITALCRPGRGGLC